MSDTAWRILIVDEQPEQRAHWRRLLLEGSEREYQFTEVESAQAACKLFTAVNPQFTCIIAPDDTASSDGPLLLNRELTRAPVVVVTTSRSHRHAKDLLARGAADYVGAHWLGPEALTRAVERAVETWDLEAALTHARQRECRSSSGPGLVDACNERGPASLSRALEEREKLLGLALEATETGLWTWNLATGHVMWSPECYRIHGLTPDEFVGSAAGFFELVHPEDRARVETTVHSAIRDRHLYECVFRILRPDASVLWVENRGRASYDTEGQATRMLGTIRDVTQRRRTEEAAGRAEALVQAVIDGTEALVFAKDLEGRYFLYNRQWLEFAGMTAEEACGITDDRVFGAAAAQLRENDRRVIESAAPLRTEERATLRGRECVYLSHKFPLRDPNGNTYGVCGISVDITELEKLQQSLSDSKRELQTLADNSPDLLTRFDKQLRHVFVNAAAEKLTGLPSAAFLNKTNRELGMPPELCKLWEAGLQRVFQTAEPESLKFVFDSGNGLKHFESRLVPELGLLGEVTHVLGLTRDVTDRHRYEEALLLADRRKDQFLATLAHELRNPLAPLRSGLDILRAENRYPDSGQKTLQIMDRQLNHLVRLVDDLLDVSRIASGKVVLRPELVSMQWVVNAALEATQPCLDAARHHVHLDLPGDAVWVRGDPTRLAQVATNLLTNAAKYTPDGGRIRVSLSAGADTARLIVQDSGIGIPERMLAHVFELFAQVNREQKRKQDGLGIGLALVKSLVAMHGGSIAVHSAGEGLGSTFTLELPRALERQGPQEQPARLEPEATSFPPRRVLVVDDNEDAAELLGSALELKGQDVRTAHDGRSALLTARQFRPDIIFLDIGLPDMDGCEVAKQLRAQPEFREALLIALTGWGSDEDKRRTASAGFDLHLTKPVEAHSVARVLSHPTESGPSTSAPEVSREREQPPSYGQEA
ncbi:MAG TPA: PAS domain-containing protein [Polyangiaceae bacterium]|nr:PAS domain-containing protein [Polyangiaceae bacterium]